MGIEESPPLMTITNLDTGEMLEPQFNPDEITERIVATYTRHKVQGHSHQPMQYDGTENLTLSFTLIFDEVAERRNNMSAAAARAFLLSCLYPSLGAETNTQQGPPTMHFFWPGIFSIVCVITEISGQHTLFMNDLQMRRWEAQIKIEEVLTSKLYSSRVRGNGTDRTEI